MIYLEILVCIIIFLIELILAYTSIKIDKKRFLILHFPILLFFPISLFFTSFLPVFYGVVGYLCANFLLNLSSKFFFKEKVSFIEIIYSLLMVFISLVFITLNSTILVLSLYFLNYVFYHLIFLGIKK